MNVQETWEDRAQQYQLDVLVMQETRKSCQMALKL